MSGMPETQRDSDARVARASRHLVGMLAEPLSPFKSILGCLSAV